MDAQYDVATQIFHNKVKRQTHKSSRSYAKTDHSVAW